MSTITVTELITRAALAADMHGNFTTSPAWVYWANVENKELAVRLVRLGFPYGLTTHNITPDGSADYLLTEPLAIVGVYRTTSNGSFVKLSYRSPTDKIPSNSNGNPTTFTMKYDPTAGAYLQFFPVPQTGNDAIVVEYIPHPNTLTAASSVYFPLNWEERVVLGMARRALTREETINPGIERLIQEIDSHIETSAYDYMIAQNNVVGRVTDSSNQGFIFV